MLAARLRATAPPSPWPDFLVHNTNPYFSSRSSYSPGESRICRAEPTKADPEPFVLGPHAFPASLIRSTRAGAVGPSREYMNAWTVPGVGVAEMGPQLGYAGLRSPDGGTLILTQPRAAPVSYLHGVKAGGTVGPRARMRQCLQPRTSRDVPVSKRCT